MTIPTTTTTTRTSWIRRAYGKLGPDGTAGVLLVIAAAVAFVWANTPWGSLYDALWATPLTVGVGSFVLSKPLLLWINDGLMAVFFLSVGLEIKREVLSGTLSSPRKAALPLFAAIGGVAVPALVFMTMGLTGDIAAEGWAIPTATDIAFAVGILAILGSRVPVELKVFLMAVAVVDDLVAVLIIAIFLTDAVALTALVIGAVALAGLVILNRRGVTRSWPYVLVGLVLWLALLKSGVHATIGGVLLAMTIPAKGRKSDDDAPSLLHTWEHGLHPIVLFVIMPVFALANAGIAISGGSGGGMGTTGWAVALGLLLGKPLGITLGAWIGVKTKLSELPRGIGWRHIFAVGGLGGIGFTMAIFIATLSLDGSAMVSAKLGVLLGSLVAGLLGTGLLLLVTRQAARRAHDPSARSHDASQLSVPTASP